MIYRRLFLLFLFISLFGIQLSNAGVRRVRAMYRSENTSTSIVIGWEQISGVVGTVYYDTINYGFQLNDTISDIYRWHRATDRVVDHREMKNCFARLSNLIPGKMYYFTIMDNEESTKIYSFKTMSNNPDDTLVIMSGGDSRTDIILIGETDNRQRRQAAFTIIQKIAPDFVTFSGNFIFNFPIQYSLISDAEQEWQEWLDDWSNNTTSKAINKMPLVKMLNVNTNAVTEITQSVAKCGGNVLSDGGLPIISRGVCWSMHSNPIVKDDSITNDGNTLGTFISNITGLTADTTYYIRAYAINSRDTSYGNQLNFRTGQSVTSPIVITSQIGNIYSTGTTCSANCGGDITNDGGASITARGVCWSRRVNPTIADFKTSNGTGNGVFASSITTLSPNATYYVRAYATNIAGTSYGSQYIVKIQNSYRIFPIVVAQGTHESTADLYNLFDTPNQDIYSAFNFCGDLFRLYTLNTNTAITGNQLTFLTNDLIAHPSTKWKMAHYCNPLRPHTNLVQEGELSYDYWAPLFKQYKVNLVSEVGAQTCKQTWPIIPCTSGTNCEDGFVRNDTLGTVFIGEGGCGSPLSDVNNTKIWTRASEKLDHINLIWVSKCKIEVRAIDYSNAYNLARVNDVNRFVFPIGMKFWETDYGKVFVIADRECLPSVEITSPADNSYISSINPVILTAEASDYMGSINKVEYYSDDTLIGSATTPPYNVSHVFGRNRTHNVVAMAYDNDGNNNISYPIRLISANSHDTLVKVIASNDDAEESTTDGSVNIQGVFLNMNSESIVGVRFNRPNIPQGKEILGAYIQFTSGSNDNSASNIKIIGEYGSNARSYTSASNNISNRRTTNEFVTWTPQTWMLDSSRKAEKTPDLGLILQEIVNQPGWDKYSSLAFIFKDSIGSRSAYSYDNNPSKAPILTFEYKIPSTVGIVDNTPSDKTLVSEIYPNPAKDRVYLKLHSNKKFSIKVYDMIGNICKSIELNECSGIYQMNISGLKTGVYIMSLDNGTIKQTEKLIVK